jgi:type IV pilus assembly protein PilM
MTDHVVGIELDAAAVRAVEVRKGAVRNAVEVPLPPGTVVHGEIQDAAAVGRALKLAWKQGRFGTRRVVIGVGNQLSVVRPLALPPLSPADLRAALRFELADLVPFPAQESVTDAVVLDGVRPEVAHGEHDRSMLAVVVHESAVTAILDVAAAARLQLHAIDLVPFALVRANGSPAMVLDVAGTTPALGVDPDPVGEALVHLSGEVISIVVHVDGVPRFARLVVDRSTSNAQMTAEIEAALALIETIRQRSAGAGPADGTPPAPAKRDPVAEAIRSTLEYFAYQPGAVPIGAVRLSGLPMRVRQLVEPLAASCDAEVTVHNPLAGRWAAAPEDGERFAAALGLALSSGFEVTGPPALHLLPPKVAAQRQRRRQLLVGVPAGLIAVAALGTAVITLGPDPGAEQAALDRLTTELTAAQAELSPYQATLDALTAASSVEQQRAQLLAGSIAAHALLSELAAITPAGLEIRSLTVEGTAPAGAVVEGATPGGSVTFDVVGDPAAVEAFLAALRAGTAVTEPTVTGDPAAGAVVVSGRLGAGVIGTRTAAGTTEAAG